MLLTPALSILEGRDQDGLGWKPGGDHELVLVLPLVVINSMHFATIIAEQGLTSLT